MFGVRLRTEWLFSVLKVLPPSARTTSTSSRNSSIELHVLPKELNEKVVALHFPALGEVLTVLAREHADYTGVKVEALPRVNTTVTEL